MPGDLTFILAGVVPIVVASLKAWPALPAQHQTIASGQALSNQPGISKYSGQLLEKAHGHPRPALDYSAPPS
jgi:hypothetical protein